MVHVREILEEFAERGVNVLGVMADDPELLRKYLTFHEAPIRVLNDESKEVIGTYGLLDDTGPPHGIVAKPAYLILDPDGVIRYFYLSSESSDIPGDEEVLGVLDGIQE